MRKWLIICIACILGCFSHAKADELGKQYIVTHIDVVKDNPYAGELFTATIYANCFGEELTYLLDVPKPVLNKGEFSFVKQLENNERPHRINDGNRDGIAIPIAKYVLKVDRPGTKKLTFTDVEGVAQFYVRKYDPFWGIYNDAEQKNVLVAFEPVELNIKALPTNKRDVAFSGVIGEFNLNVEVPRGDIIVNDPGVIYIVLSGKGFIPDDIMPDYQNAFGEKIKLRSIEGDSQIFHNGKEICSKHIWRCEIVPQEVGDCEIESVKFGYFNSNTDRYEELKSDPVIINVKSSTIKLESLEV